ncbi:hypothetical protein JTB14_003707 [Gonioctena quinquepunctata]|nr:hypothetical protein JTB14_003707 [Gonioctena quinquepunctata]
MVFGIQGKVGLVTGGASGIGLKYAKELLRNGLKGVTLADLNEDFGKNAVKEIEEEFGPNRAKFVRTDVTSSQQFDDAFKKTIEKFKNIDILINNAGILNDAIWEKEVEVNIKGTVHGVLLATEKYFPKHKQGSEGVIVNISSSAGLSPYAFMPIYSGTKHAIVGMTKSWGDSFLYEQLKTRFVAICPGVTNTPLIFDIAERNMGGIYQKSLEDNIKNWPSQEPDHVGKEMIKVIENAPNGTIWVVEGGEPAYEYVPTSRKHQ